jgi:hypothetical protein
VSWLQKKVLLRRMNFCCSVVNFMPFILLSPSSHSHSCLQMDLHRYLWMQADLLFISSNVLLLHLSWKIFSNSINIVNPSLLRTYNICNTTYTSPLTNTHKLHLFNRINLRCMNVFGRNINKSECSFDVQILVH